MHHSRPLKQLDFYLYTPQLIVFQVLLYDFEVSILQYKPQEFYLYAKDYYS